MAHEDQWIDQCWSPETGGRVWLDHDTIFLQSPATPFHIRHGDDGMNVVVCRQCGGMNFFVGVNNTHYATAIKCTGCLWEITIHEG